MLSEKDLAIAKRELRGRNLALSGAGNWAWTHWKPGDAMAKSQIT
jgi:hypothetical protein